MDQLYTDGACKGNPGRDGWAFLLGGPLLDFDDHTERTLSGGKANTTTNRMALGAIIEGLKSIPHGEEVEISIDSIDPIAVATSKNRKFKHMDLIEVDCQRLAQVKPGFTHVKGHSGHPENERVATLASSSACQQHWMERVRE